MSEELEAAVEPVETKKSGSGVSGFVGGTAGVIAGGHFTKKYLQEKKIGHALHGDEKATEKYNNLVHDAREANSELATAESSLRVNGEKLTNLNSNLAGIHEVNFATDAAGKHTMTVSHGAGTVEFPNLDKLPKNVTAGTPITDATEIKTLLEGEKSYAAKMLAKEEKTLIKNIGKEAGYWKSLKAVSIGEAGLITGGIVVAGVAGNKVLHAIFGGNHTKAVDAGRAAAVDNQAVIG